MKTIIQMREHPAIYVLHDTINTLFFGDALELPNFYQDDEAQGFAACFFRDDEADFVGFNADVLKPDAPFDDLVHCVWHEAVHQYCQQQGIRHAGKNGYHLAGFRDAARAHGLLCKKGANGWEATGLIPENRDRVVEITRIVLDGLKGRSWEEIIHETLD